MNSDPVRWYKSKIDWWLRPVLAVPPIAAAAVMYSSVRSGKPLEIAGGIATVLVVAGVYVGVVFPMRYGIGNGRLDIRFGLCRQQIELGSILEVRPTRNPLSSPALSLDRIEVRYGRESVRTIMISPEHRQRFLADLAESSGLMQDGDRLFSHDQSPA